MQAEERAEAEQADVWLLSMGLLVKPALSTAASAILKHNPFAKHVEVCSEEENEALRQCPSADGLRQPAHWRGWDNRRDPLPCRFKSTREYGRGLAQLVREEAWEQAQAAASAELAASRPNIVEAVCTSCTVPGTHTTSAIRPSTLLQLRLVRPSTTAASESQSNSAGWAAMRHNALVLLSRGKSAEGMKASHLVGRVSSSAGVGGGCDVVVLAGQLAASGCNRPGTLAHPILQDMVAHLNDRLVPLVAKRPRAVADAPPPPKRPTPVERSRGSAAAAASLRVEAVGKAAAPRAQAVAQSAADAADEDEEGEVGAALLGDVWYCLPLESASSAVRELRALAGVSRLSRGVQTALLGTPPQDAAVPDTVSGGSQASSALHGRSRMSAYPQAPASLPGLSHIPASPQDHASLPGLSHAPASPLRPAALLGETNDFAAEASLAEQLPAGFLEHRLFALNPSQRSAVRAALAPAGLTLVQGPPGTGKTTTVLAALNCLHLAGLQRWREVQRRGEAAVQASEAAADPDPLLLCRRIRGEAAAQALVAPTGSGPPLGPSPAAPSGLLSGLLSRAKAQSTELAAAHRARAAETAEGRPSPHGAADAAALQRSLARLRLLTARRAALLQSHALSLRRSHAALDPAAARHRLPAGSRSRVLPPLSAAARHRLTAHRGLASWLLGPADSELGLLRASCAAVHDRPRVLVCAHSNAAADNILARVVSPAGSPPFLGAPKPGTPAAPYNPSVLRVGSADKAAPAVRAAGVVLSDQVDALLRTPRAALEQQAAALAAHCDSIRASLRATRRAFGDDLAAALAAAARESAARESAADGTDDRGGDQGDDQDDDQGDCAPAGDHSGGGGGRSTSPAPRRLFPDSPGPGSAASDAALLATLDARVLAWSERLLITLEDWQRASAHRERLEWAKQAASAPGGAARAHAREAIQWSLVDGADLVFSTLSSAAVTALDTYCRQTGHGFESVVVDEAAQAPEASTLIPLRYGCERCLLVGDPQQLPATVISPAAARLGLDRSLFARLAHAGLPALLLDQQHRMHPAISAFPSARFYAGRLRDAPAVRGAAREQPFHALPHFKPLLFFDLAGTPAAGSAGTRTAGRSHKNEAEAALAAGLLGCLMRWRGRVRAPHGAPGSPAEWETRMFTGSVAVLTPYQGQIPALRAALDAEYARSNAIRASASAPNSRPMLPTLIPEIATVDSAQGREFDVVIFSAVRTGSAGAQKPPSEGCASRKAQIGFVKDKRRMNVALTRGKFAVWVIGDAKTLGAGSDDWAALWKHAGITGAQMLVPDVNVALDRMRALDPES